MPSGADCESPRRIPAGRQAPRQAMTGEPPPQNPCHAIGLFFARVSSAAIPFTVFAVLLAAIAGWIGGSMGIPTLFRDDPALAHYGWSAIGNSPGIWGHAGATWLLMVILGGIFVTERLARHLPPS